MPTFDAFDLNWIRKVIAGANKPWQEMNRKFYDGDHWLEADGWIGPRPPMNDPAYRDTIAEIQRGFISKNAVKEVVDRHMNGVLGLEPTWSITVRRPLEEEESPLPEEQALIDEAEALLTDWWNKRGVQRVLQKALVTADLEKRAALRLFVPRGKVINGVIPTGPILEQLDRIFIQHPGTDQATVVTDDDTMEQAAVYFYMDQKNQERAELVYLDDDGNTVIRWLDAAGMAGEEDTGGDDDPGGDGDDATEPPDFVAVDLGRNLTVFEFDRDVLITPQVVANQKLLNEALTMLQRNVALGGFLERVILNGQVPGHWEPNADDPDRVWIQDKFRVGAGTTNVIAGLTQTNAEGIETYATPSIVYRDPVKVDTFIETERTAYLKILEEVQQLHAAISGDATASGESRRQAMAGFISDLRQTKSRIDEAGRWVLETALFMAAAFAGTPGKYRDLRADFNSRIDPGPIPADEMRLAMEAYDKGILSQESAMNRIGVEDTDLEKAKIQAERQADLDAQGILGEEGEGVDFGGEDGEAGDEEDAPPPASKAATKKAGTVAQRTRTRKVGR